MAQVWSREHPPSLKEVVSKLNFWGLPRDEDKLASSAQALYRIIKGQISKGRDRMGDVIFSELLPIVQDKYANPSKEIESRINDIDFNEYKISPTHSDYYIYFYVSVDDKTEEFTTKFALIGFDIDPKKHEWNKGSIYYFRDNKIQTTFRLQRVPPKKGENPNALFFKAFKDSQVNFFTIKKTDEMERRGFLPLTYSVTETVSKLVCAGKGFLQKVTESNYIKEIHTLLKNGIPGGIINALYFNKHFLKESVLEKPSDFRNLQTELITPFIGFWEGGYFRHDLKESKVSSANDEGGLIKFVLYIKESCECELHYKIKDPNFHCYRGFIEFPSSLKSLMKISLEFSANEKTYRMFAFLSGGSTGSPNYAGVISGWTNDKVIFSSTMYMKIRFKKDENISLEEALDIIQPQRIVKKEPNIYLENKTLIDALRTLEQKYLATFSNCMP